MAAQVMQEGRVQAVVTGADRIAANGDTANKIGTYGVAVLAAAHNIPFYVAAPTSTFDLWLATGDTIPIEQRDGRRDYPRFRSHDRARRDRRVQSGLRCDAGASDSRHYLRAGPDRAGDARADRRDGEPGGAGISSMFHPHDALAILASLEGSASLWWILSLWTFCVGGAIGSFMNVVVYRMPAGLSIVRPSSFCPHCKHPIRLRHNQPIIGWFMLRGKCYDCGARISPRYPLVEAVVAGLFLFLCHIEVFSGGANLPGLVVGAAELPLFTLWATYGYHLLLCCTLLCIALVEFDGNQVPLRLWLPILLVGLITPLILPALHQVPFYWPFARQLTLNPTLVVALDGLCGLLIAAALAWPTPWLARMVPSTGTALCRHAAGGRPAGLAGGACAGQCDDDRLPYDHRAGPRRAGPAPRALDWHPDGADRGLPRVLEAAG